MVEAFFNLTLKSAKSKSASVGSGPNRVKPLYSFAVPFFNRAIRPNLRTS